MLSREKKKLIQDAYTFFFEALEQAQGLKGSEGLLGWYENTKCEPEKFESEYYLTAYIEPLETNLPFSDLFGPLVAHDAENLESMLSEDIEKRMNELRVKNPDLDDMYIRNDAEGQIRDNYFFNNIDLFRIRIGISDNHLVATINTESPTYNIKDYVFYESSIELDNSPETLAYALDEFKDSITFRLNPSPCQEATNAPS